MHHYAAVVGKLDGITGNVHQYLNKACRIGNDIIGAGWLYHEYQFQMLVKGIGCQQLYGIIKQVPQREGLGVNR